MRLAVALFVLLPVVFMVFCIVAGRVSAQDLQSQRSPFSAYLDLRPTPGGTSAQTVPEWIEAFEFLPGNPHESATDKPVVGNEVDAKTRSVFRIRVQRPRDTSDDLQMRVFFEDRSLASRPRVTAWDELGTELMRSLPLGQGLGLATSETLTIPMNGVNYLEIGTSDDGSQVRGVFFTWLEKAQIRQPIDFPNLEKIVEPFRVISAIRTRENDSFLYGVVTASLLKEPLNLNATAPVASIQFELERQPLVAIVSYEVLGASINEPPTLRANSRSVGALELASPDLADPGYQGQSRNGETGLSFHYTGWVHAQKVIPGQLLIAGLNELNLELSNGSDALAIRSVEIQLKYNWEKLDYVLAPAPNSSVR